jgi:TolB protein
MNDRLHAALHDLADDVEATDLYTRAVRRSGRIARREAAIGTGAALLVLGVLAAGLWRLPTSGHRQPPVALAPVASLPSGLGPTSGPPDATDPYGADPTGPAPVTDRTTRARPSPPPRLMEPPAEPHSRVLADLPGQVFYQEPGDKPDVLRLRPADGRTDRVLADAPSPVGISPDGSRIAYVADGTLLVGTIEPGGTGAGQVEPLAHGVAIADQEPVWSPGGDRLMVHTQTTAVVEVGSGTVTPLPGGLGAGRHFRWSGDGSKLVYATATCELEMAGSAAGSGAAVPLGDSACRPGSVDTTGRRVAVSLNGPGTPDAVLDTTTGGLMTLPVSGQVLGAVFDPDGQLLVRSLRAGVTRLSLIAPDNSLVVQATEPAAVRDLELIAYTG